MTTRRARWARVVRRVLRRSSKRCSAPLQSSWESLGEMLGNIDGKKRLGGRKNPSQEAVNQQLEHLMNCSIQALIGLPERLFLRFWIHWISSPKISSSFSAFESASLHELHSPRSILQYLHAIYPACPRLPA